MITTKDKKIISCKAMITEILDDGEKLRSLRQLKERYQLLLPFTAYKVKGAGAGEVYTIIKYVSPHEEEIIVCSCCGGRRWAEGDSYISLDPVCPACLGNDGEGVWDPDTENWKLA